MKKRIVLTANECAAIKNGFMPMRFVSGYVSGKTEDMMDKKKVGLFEKYIVKRTDKKSIKDGCIVLEWKDANARAGIRTFSKAVRIGGYTRLADDLDIRLSSYPVSVEDKALALADEMKKDFTIGSYVIVYDRYRFAIPLKSRVTKLATVNDGVEVELLQSNSTHYPIGAKIWVDAAQLRRGLKPMSAIEQIHAVEDARVFADLKILTADAVNGPAHYGGADNPYECIKVLEKWGLDLDFMLGNAVKYISRAGKKDSTKLIEDLEKAEYYLKRRIANLKKKSEKL